MIKPERMTKISLVYPKTYAEKVISTLYDLHVYHLIDHKKTKEMDIGSPLAHSEELAEVLVKLRAILSALNITPTGGYSVKDLTKKDYESISKKVHALHEEIVEHTETVKKTQEEVVKLKEKQHLLKLLQSLKVDTASFTSGVLDVIIGHVDNPDELRKSIAQHTSNFELIKTKSENKYLTALFIEKTAHAAVTDALNTSGFHELNFNDVLETLKEGKTSVHNYFSTLNKERVKVEQEKHKAELRLGVITKEQKSFLVKYEGALSEESKKAELPLKFGSTTKSFFSSGWIPTRKVSKVQSTLEEATNGKIYIDAQEPKAKDAPPIKLKNPVLVKSFEFLTNLYELPTYKELDPSFLMFLTFPIFFGFMLGDVGYGLITLLLFAFLRKKMPAAKQLLTIMIIASVITIGFGFAFGEAFGFEHVSYETGKAWCLDYGFCLPVHEVHVGHEVVKVADFPRLFNRVHSHMNVFGFEMLSVLIIGAIIGFIHLNLALLIGFYNEMKAHGAKHAFLEKISWMVMQAGVILLVAGLTKAIPLRPEIGGLVIGIGIILIYLGEGVKGMVELPAIFSNMLSYMRLGAVGLASVGLAVVVNENLAMPFIEKGGWYLIIAMIIMVLGHGINIALGIIGPFLHSIRLHYVEFFSKFYHGGGLPYIPFGYKKKEE
jgi:V/A-type H+/Na+-transporting ATPase subunit I